MEHRKRGNDTLESGTEKMQPIGPSNKRNVNLLLRYNRMGTHDAILRLSWSGKRSDGQEFEGVYRNVSIDHESTGSNVATHV